MTPSEIAAKTNFKCALAAGYSFARIYFPFPAVIAVIRKGYSVRRFRLTSSVHLFKFVIDANLDNSSIKVLPQRVVCMYNEAHVGSDGFVTEGVIFHTRRP